MRSCILERGLRKIIYQKYNPTPPTLQDSITSVKVFCRQ